jgi:methionine aminopeptidase
MGWRVIKVRGEIAVPQYAFRRSGRFRRTCALVNNCVVHGVPNDTPLGEGDLV